MRNTCHVQMRKALISVSLKLRFALSVLVAPFIVATTCNIASAQNGWIPVGNPYFSSGGAAYTAMAIDGSSGTPYVVYQDSSLGKKITVKKFDGTNWVIVGAPGFSDGEADFAL